MKKILSLCLLALAPNLFAQSLEVAQDALNRGQYKLALDEFDKYLARKPRDANARFSRGLALVMLERDDDAIKAFSDLARDFPDMPEAYNNLAVLFARAGRYEQARDALESALVTHPSYAPAHENLGDIYAALAQAAYNRASVLDKDNRGIQGKLDVLAQLDQLREGVLPSPPTVAAAAPAATPEPRQAAAAAAVAAPRATPQPAATPISTPRPTPSVAAASPARPVSDSGSISALSTAPVLSGTTPVLGTGAPAASGASAGPAPARDQAAIVATVERWRAAWSAKDVDAYLATYSPDFDPTSGVERSVWESQRRTRLVRPRSINVQAVDIEVSQVSPSYAHVRFLQIYESDSYTDQVRKRLELEKRNGQWLITQERVEN